MESSSFIGLALIISFQNAESRSALPNAPVVDDGRAHRVERFTRTRARLATVLHRAAWALEPKKLALALEGRTPSPRKPTLCHDC